MFAKLIAILKKTVPFVESQNAWENGYDEGTCDAIRTIEAYDPWIPITESTPELPHWESNCGLFSDPVLLRLDRTVGSITVGTFEQWDSGSYHWYTNCMEKFDVTNQVTHWMPLPPQPKNVK